MRKYGVIIIISFVWLMSCDRTVPCQNQFVTPAFIGFNLSDLDTLVVREYEKNDNFLTLLDTAIIVTDSSSLIYNTSNDTTIVLLNYISGQEKYIFPDHDWQIYIPAQNIVISMSNFVSPQGSEKCFLGGDLCPSCLNAIDSFVQNGQEVIPQYGSGYNLTYIHR